MAIYDIIIEETISQSFQIEANSEEEALQKGEEGYSLGDFILENPNLTSVMLLVDKEDGNDLNSDWTSIY